MLPLMLLFICRGIELFLCAEGLWILRRARGTRKGNTPGLARRVLNISTPHHISGPVKVANLDNWIPPKQT